MSVGNVLSCYAVHTSMQYNNASGLTSKTEAQFKITSQSSSSGDAVLDYYHNLCSKFPDISFRLSDMEESLKHMNDRRPYFGYNDSLNQVGDNYSEMGQVSIDIDAAVIRKMQNNPDFEEAVLFIGYYSIILKVQNKLIKKGTNRVHIKMTVLQTSFLLVFSNTPNIRVPSRARLVESLECLIIQAF